MAGAGAGAGAGGRGRSRRALEGRGRAGGWALRGWGKGQLGRRKTVGWASRLSRWHSGIVAVMRAQGPAQPPPDSAPRLPLTSTPFACIALPPRPAPDHSVLQLTALAAPPPLPLSCSAKKHGCKLKVQLRLRNNEVHTAELVLSRATRMHHVDPQQAVRAACAALRARLDALLLQHRVVNPLAQGEAGGAGGAGAAGAAGGAPPAEYPRTLALMAAAAAAEQRAAAPGGSAAAGGAAAGAAAHGLAAQAGQAGGSHGGGTAMAAMPLAGAGHGAGAGARGAAAGGDDDGYGYGSAGEVDFEVEELPAKGRPGAKQRRARVQLDLHALEAVRRSPDPQNALEHACAWLSVAKAINTPEFQAMHLL